MCFMQIAAESRSCTLGGFEEKMKREGARGDGRKSLDSSVDRLPGGIGDVYPPDQR